MKTIFALAIFATVMNLANANVTELKNNRDSKIEGASISIERLKLQVNSIDESIDELYGLQESIDKAESSFSTDLTILSKMILTINTKVTMLVQENQVKSAQYAMLDVISRHALFTSRLAEFKENRVQEQSFCQLFSDYVMAQNSNLRALEHEQGITDVQNVVGEFVTELASVCNKENQIIRKGLSSKLLTITTPIPALKRWIYAVKIKKQVRKKAYAVTNILQNVDPQVIANLESNQMIQIESLKNLGNNVEVLSNSTLSNFELIVMEFRTILENIENSEKEINSIIIQLESDLKNISQAFDIMITKIENFIEEDKKQNAKIQELKAAKALKTLKETHYELHMNLLSLTDDTYKEALLCKALAKYSQEQMKTLELLQDSKSLETIAISRFIKETQNTCNNLEIILKKNELNDVYKFILERDFEFTNDLIKAEFIDQKLEEITKLSLNASDRLRLRK